uniref:Rho-GAP domain-containing protein n=1 Tax=Ciona savignyi TaxID=51511 RepID=H2Z808_CIOSA
MIERQGRLYWTKLVEAGKKQRKNWIQQWVVLLANNLLFYKDQKQAVMTKSMPHGKPDSSCDLRGAEIDWARDKSSKKNVLELKTVRGLSLLLQHEDISTIQKWLTAIKVTIQRAFINRRPTMESLQERGIIKETVFGCPLDKLCEKEQTTIPNFIKLCVTEVERRGLDVDGIYRVSGNLSHVQKLRYMVDRGKIIPFPNSSFTYIIISNKYEPVDLSEPEWEDIHLITGALKMFLRELPEPVIPFAFFDKFVAACKIRDTHERQKVTKALVQALPRVNSDTLTYLMEHFCSGMAIYMAFQNQIIDYMLCGFDVIFK